jgi:hypothetical protein
MKEIKVTWAEKKKSISQVYSSGIEYAFLTENFEMIHQFVYCKDFMQDAIAGYLQNKTMSIYGFSYNPKTCLPIYSKKTRLLFTNCSDKAMANRIPGSKDFLNQIEKKLKMHRTQIYTAFDPPKQYAKSGVYIYDGSKRWMISPPMISLYTLLMRVSLVHKVGDDFMNTVTGVSSGKIPGMQTEDQYQMKNAEKAFKWILDKGDRKLFFTNQIDNFKDQSVNTMHNDLGIVAYSSGCPKKNFPKWYKEVEA